METFNLKKLNKIEVSNRFAALEDLDPEVELNSAWEDGDGWIILRWNLERQDGAMWTGLVWLRIGTSGELL
jgi:hypothetical protein